MFSHNDNLQPIDQNVSLQEKLVSIHQTIQKKFSFIDRIAITIYDPETRVLKTFMHSSGDDNPLENYQSLLDEAHSLKEILNKGKPRVVNNLTTFENSTNIHAKRIGRQGYTASYTMPMYDKGVFFGFLFFNSYIENVFNETTLNDLDVYGHLISLMVAGDFKIVKMMNAAIKTTGNIVHARYPETGGHLDRMSRYSRIIAAELADKYKLNDDYIEHVFMFSPLHDIGKIAIPDNILLKPGKLNSKEQEIMRSHTKIGKELIDDLINNFDLSTSDNISILKNIAEFHHEAVNGSGYPAGKKNDEIPLEARIVAVADVFDALTSKRSYKNAWSNEESIKILLSYSGETLDQDCVNALVKNEQAVKLIQEQFKESDTE
ncbi:MAG: HD domain-containing protein [Gammaproteobacteria bacterium]|nr:HD domain-containing protein [Gammaproteobacteria bacterium]